jgi:carbamoyl-phosphate synthase large subunit
MVTAVGGIGVGEQIVKALRMAGGYRIIGADVHREVAQARLVDEFAVLPRASDPRYVDELVMIAGQYSASAIFYGSEAELRVMSAERDRIRGAGFFLPLNPAKVIEAGMNKMATMVFLEANGFPTPRSMMITDLESVEEIDYFPVVVKPIYESGGSRDVHIVQSADELRLVFQLLPAKSLMIQEYVGRPDAEYTVGVLHDMEGAFVNSIALHRRLDGLLNVRHSTPNRTHRQELGPELVISSGVSHGFVDHFPEVTKTCERIAATLGVLGPVNIQCRLVGDEVYVFEMNPRFSGTTSIRAMFGYNEPDVLIRRHLLGENVETRFPYGSGLVLRSLTETLVPGGRDH